MELKNFYVQDQDGNAQPGIPCYLYLAGTDTLATVVLDANGIQKTNPFNTDVYGLAQFKAPDGEYDLRVVSETRDYRIRLQCVDSLGAVEAIEEIRIAKEVAVDSAASALDSKNAANTLLINTQDIVSQAQTSIDAKVSSAQGYAAASQTSAGAAAESAQQSATSAEASASAASIAVTNQINLLKQQLAASTGAEMVGYNGGTSTQTIKDRLGKVVMATDYTFLKAACDSNLNVLVPPGNYVVTSLITVRDNQTITFMPGAIVTQVALGNAGIFNFPAGVKNVVVQGRGTLRGPAFGRTPNPMGVYPQSNGAIRMTGTAVNPVVNPIVSGLILEGWDDYGIFAENVRGHRFNDNTIRDIGRDGMRLYGVSDGQTNFNNIDNIAPGLSGNGANLNVYGITYTRRADNVSNPTTTNPPSRRSEAIGNIITNCLTWKGLDTHGGVDILFANNIIGNCHIAIGIDEGDTSGYSDSPPTRVKCIGNILYRGTGNAGGAGINMSSSDIGNMGSDVELTSNTIRGFGGVGTGAINIAYQLRPQIRNNQLLDCITSGINIPGGVRVVGFSMSGNMIKNVLPDGANPALAAVTIQSPEVSGTVDGISLVRDDGTMIGFSLPTFSTDYGVNIGGEIQQTGTITLFSANSPARVSGGGYVMASRGYGRVTSSGALAHNNGVLSATRISIGVYEVVLRFSAQSVSTLHVFPTRRSNAAGSITADVTAVNTFRVYTFNASNAAADVEFSFDTRGV